jgi:hypothetical protein
MIDNDFMVAAGPGMGGCLGSVKIQVLGTTDKEWEILMYIQELDDRPASVKEVMIKDRGSR